MVSYWQWKSLFIQLYKDKTSGTSKAANKKSMNFLNLHVDEHWPYSIKKFGMPTEYSMQHWELLHQQIKQKEKKTNHKVPTVYVAQQIIEQKGLKYKYGSVEVSNICLMHKVLPF
jgi:hypothetical protein